MRRTFASFALAVAATLAATAPSHAFTPGGQFRATGDFIFRIGSNQLGCRMTVAVDSGLNQIVQAQFSGASYCPAFTPVGLPWPIVHQPGPPGPTLTIQGMAMNTPFGNCAPTASNVVGAWNNTLPGGATFYPAIISSAPLCQVASGSLITAPPQTLP